MIFLLYCTYKYDYKGVVRHKTQSFYFCMIILIAVAGLRYRIGVDTIRYEFYFDLIPELSKLTWDDIFLNITRADPLYVILTSLSKTVYDQFWFMQLVHAIIVNSIFFRFVKSNTKNIFFAILCYYSMLYLNFMCEVMRESMAVSMFLLAWEYYKVNKWSRYYFYCILAVLFHSSALVTFLLPLFELPLLVRVTNFLKKHYVITLILVFIAGSALQAVLFDYLSIFDNFQSVSEKVERYARKDTAGATFNLNGIISSFIKYIIYSIVTINIIKRDKENTEKLEFMVLVCVTFAILTIPITILYRFNNYFFPFVIIVLSNVLFRPNIYLLGIKMHVKKFTTWMLLLFPLFFMYFYEYTGDVGQTNLKNYMRYYPYESVISPKKNLNREQLFIYYNAY